MDKFNEYLKKRRSEQFFFIKDYTLAVLRFSDRTEIVDMATGEVLKTLKVSYMSEAVYCGKYNKLYLKSIGNGCIYVYDFAEDSLKKLFKLAESDNGIFLSCDEEKLIAYTYGYVYEIETKTDDFRLLFESENKCFYGKGWDNPNKKCYEFVYVSKSIPSTLLCIGYDGSLLSQEIIELDNVHVFVNNILYSPEYDMYIMQGAEDYTRLNIKPKGNNKDFCSISKNNINNFAYMFEEKYGGGCHDTLLYKNYLLYCYGNKAINVIDINTFKLIKSVALGRTMTKMQYDPSRNALYVSTGRSCQKFDDFLINLI